MKMTDDLRDIVAEAAAEPFAGAARILRNIDPLWQAEIGEPRAWEAHINEFGSARCQCGCPNCDGVEDYDLFNRSVLVIAETAAEAFQLAEAECLDGERCDGVRIAGAGCSVIVPETLQ